MQIIYNIIYDKDFTLMKLSRFSSLALAAALAFGTAAAHAKPVQITDVNGRKVTVDLPAKRVVLGFYYQDYMAIGGKDALNNVVGFSKAVWADWAPPSWAAFSKAVPKLNQLADVGEVEVGTFSVEKVLALKPDLLILADWQYKALGSDLARINKAGIPIVVLDYNAQTVAKHIQSTKLIGTLTGQQQKADKLAADYKRIADTIQARVQKANLPKPKVYVEFGNKGLQSTASPSARACGVRWQRWSAATIFPLLRLSFTARSTLKKSLPPNPTSS